LRRHLIARGRSRSCQPGDRRRKHKGVDHSLRPAAARAARYRNRRRGSFITARHENHSASGSETTDEDMCVRRVDPRVDGCDPLLHTSPDIPVPRLVAYPTNEPKPMARVSIRWGLRLECCRIARFLCEIENAFCAHRKSRSPPAGERAVSTAPHFFAIRLPIIREPNDCCKRYDQKGDANGNHLYCCELHDGR
jgi:hypothetical protein